MTKEEKTQKEEQQEEKQRREYLEERVPICLHQPEGCKLSSRTVTINGKNYQIAYGKQVLVPRFVALVIEESLENEGKARENADALVEEYKSGMSTI